MERYSGKEEGDEVEGSWMVGEQGMVDSLSEEKKKKNEKWCKGRGEQYLRLLFDIVEFG